MKTTKIFSNNFKALYEGKELIINQGGTSSSKSYSILQLFIYLLYHPKVKNKTFSIVSESMPHLSKGAMFDFFKILNEEGLYKRDNHNLSNSTYKVNSNIIQFFSVDDESRVRGPRRDFLFINEANNVKYDTFRQLNMRTLNTTFLDFNPVQSFWAHTLTDQDNCCFIKSTYKDNPYTPKKVIDEIERLKLTDPNWYKVYGLGEIGSLEGLVYTFNICDFEDSEKKVYGLDFGYTNDPTTLVSVYEKDRNLYADELLYQAGLTNPDISVMLEKLGLRKRKDVIYCDSAEPKSIEELSRMGWLVKPALKGPDSIIAGINTIKSYGLNVSKRSLNLIKELRNYQWLKDKDGKLTNRPVGIDHLLDSLRYAVVSHYRVEPHKTKIKIL